MTKLEKARHARRALDEDYRELSDAVREWLRFDNDVEPPKDDASYADHVEYETRKMAITEKVASLLRPARDA